MAAADIGELPKFPAPDRARWEAAARKASGGLPPEDLTPTSADGINIQPLYTADDADLVHLRPNLLDAPPFTRGVTRLGGRWDLRQRHDLDGEVSSSAVSPSVSPSETGSAYSPSAVAEAIREDLNGGVTSIWLRLLSPPAADSLGEALAGVDLQETPVVVDGGPWYIAAARALSEATDDALTLASAPADPLGALARYGWLTEPLDATLDALGERMADLIRRLPSSVKTSEASGGAAQQPPRPPRPPQSLRAPQPTRAICLDATPYADAGASPALEIACLLASGAAYLEAICARGVDAAAAAALMEARLSTTTNQFTSLVKLRAARTAWDRLLVECGVPSALRLPLRCWAVTSEADIAAFDPAVNLVRATISAFAAVCGGADCLSVLPGADAAVNPAGRVPAGRFRTGEYARRLARNVSHLLAEESHLGAVNDPAGGSWYVETYTQRLAAAAWDRFREISARGGLPVCLLDGSLAADVLSAWQQRLDKLAAGSERVVGVTHYLPKSEGASAVALDPVSGAVAPVSGGAAGAAAAPGGAAVSDIAAGAATAGGAAAGAAAASGGAAGGLEWSVPEPMVTTGVSIPPLPLRRPQPDHVPAKSNG